MNQEGLLLDLADNEWPISTIDHDRLIARAIVVDNEDNFYFLCKVISFGDKHLTKDEIEDFHLSTLKLYIHLNSKEGTQNESICTLACL